MNCLVADKTINEIVITTPIADLEIKCCSLGLHELKIKNFIFKKTFKFQDLQNEVFIKSIQYSHLNYDSINTCLTYFENYFSLNISNQDFNLPSICWRSFCDKDSFTEKILRTLSNQVLIGQRVSYKELATLSGRENAQRAVGTVMRKNPIPFIIPCHRVVKSSNLIDNMNEKNIGNYTCSSYSSGVEIKKWLLNYEKCFLF